MNYLVVDSEFNRTNYPSLVGKVLDSPPAYAQVRKFDGEASAEDTVGARVIKTLVTRTINDITMDQMNRIVRRLSRMPRAERGIAVRVADVIAE